MKRDHPYEDEFLGTDRTEALRLGLVAGKHLAGPLHKPQPIEPLLAELDLADEAQWYTVRVWLDAGYTPRFTFRNGLMDARRLWSRLMRRYPEQFPNPGKRKGIVEARYDAIHSGRLPHIRIYEVELSGPHWDSWPTASQRPVLGEGSQTILESGRFPSSQAMRQALERFAALAYRLPPTADRYPVMKPSES
ncbi:hypothetical protein [Aureliella helgolandensis]|uniref:hypothetical protein n=1 Tax=Aureliella helgolandensis TaxID=2527968 RepID=UPI00119D4CAE|nr:hypothetical protein [Aureliella helgolandensis]